MKPQAGVAVLHRRHLGKRSAISSGILTGYLRKQSGPRPHRGMGEHVSTLNHENSEINAFQLSDFDHIFVLNSVICPYVICIVNKV